MNKMAFKAFFITAFSQTERDSCRASDEFRLGRKDFFDFPYRKNVQSVSVLKRFKCDSRSDESNMSTLDTGQHGGEGVLYILTVNLNTREYGNYDKYFCDFMINKH